MAKRGATEQITKDTWEREDERDSRDRSEEPAEVASQAVLAKRKILKPRSRVSGASSLAATPTSQNLFGNQSTPASATPLFGQSQATPSKNLFGSAIATPSASLGLGSAQSQSNAGTSLFGTPLQANATPKPSGSLFGMPSAAPQTTNAARSGAALFGSPAGKDGTTVKTETSLFGTPSGTASFAPKMDSFNPAASKQTPNGSTNPINFSSHASGDSSSSLFGFSSAKQNPSVNEAPKASTTPNATPQKANPFAQFGNPSPSIGSNSDAKPSASLFPTVSKPLFGSGSTSSKPLESSNSPSLFGATNTENNHVQTSKPVSNHNLFAPTTFTSKSTAPVPSPTANPLKSPKQAAPPAAASHKPDPKSLVPPTTSNLKKDQMPTFNWMYQIRSLNHQYLEQVQKAIADDPYADLSAWADFYQKQVASFASLRLSQKNEVSNEMNVDDASNEDNNIPMENTETTTQPFQPSAPKASNDISYPQLPSEPKEQQSSTTPGLFGQTSSAFTSSAPPSSLFGNKQSAPVESKPTPFLFGSGSQTPGSIFDSSTPKNPASNLFSWNSKPSSAVPSNASSPGSVLAGGTAGLKDNSTGGWSNPFTQDNPMFLTQNDDDDDDDEEEEKGDDTATGSGGNGHNGNENKSIFDTAPIQESATKAQSSTSLESTQPTPQNSLFGRAGGTSNSIFGTPKTGSVGLFNTSPSPAGSKTWTPDKGIVFGSPAESKNANVGPTNQTPSLFAPAQGANKDSSTAPKSLFGNNVPSFNFSQPTNGNSIFGGGAASASKPASSLFQTQSTNSLAPPLSAFGGASPAPSDISTPGESSHKEGGEEENEPSDDAGREGNTKDLSGRGPGEEDEDEVFEARSSIYNLNKGAYVKIGIGRLRVLKNRNTSRSRIVVKVETGKVLMNVGLRKEIDYSKVSESEAQGKVVKVLEFLPGGESRVWVMKVGTVELAQQLRKSLDENK